MEFSKFVAMFNKGKITCGKIRYETEHNAKQALFNARAGRKSTHKKECRYYLCASCKGYHLTSQASRGTVSL